MDKFAGQHLYIKKAAGSYTHHGIGVGDGCVMHYSGMANGVSLNGKVEQLSLEAFAQGLDVHIKQQPDRKYSVQDSLLRAQLRLGECQYHLLHNNCEHFVEWCINGSHRSFQARRGKLLYSLGVGTRAVMYSKNPTGFVLGAAAGYAYIHKKGLKSVPDFETLEKQFLQLKERVEREKLP